MIGPFELGLAIALLMAVCVLVSLEVDRNIVKDAEVKRLQAELAEKNKLIERLLAARGGRP